MAKNLTYSYKTQNIDMNGKFGLIGTITFDHISQESRPSWEGMGGVLYQAAVLCALEREVYLYTNLGRDLSLGVENIIKKWPTLRKEGINLVNGPGNQVYLHYPLGREREEVLRSVVPPLDPWQIIEDLPGRDMLILVNNSGFDIEPKEWRRVVQKASCPLWLDIHSLPLSKEMGVRRKYMSFPEWKEWAKGVHFVQANRQEMASMLGYPDKEPSEEEMRRLSQQAFSLGTEAVFVTLGKEGVLVLTPEETRRISSPLAGEVVDTTGCGDVFCAATTVALFEGKDPFEASAFGLKLASKAVRARGIQETYQGVRLL
jgi:hypothetical protein